jgi:hypothetical protein
MRLPEFKVTPDNEIIYRNIHFESIILFYYVILPGVSQRVIFIMYHLLPIPESFEIVYTYGFWEEAMVRFEKLYI